MYRQCKKLLETSVYIQYVYMNYHQLALLLYTKTFIGKKSHENNIHGNLLTVINGTSISTVKNFTCDRQQ